MLEHDFRNKAFVPRTSSSSAIALRRYSSSLLISALAKSNSHNNANEDANNTNDTTNNATVTMTTLLTLTASLLSPLPTYVLLYHIVPFLTPHEVLVLGSTSVTLRNLFRIYDEVIWQPRCFALWSGPVPQDDDNNHDHNRNIKDSNNNNNNNNNNFRNRNPPMRVVAALPFKQFITDYLESKSYERRQLLLTVGSDASELLNLLVRDLYAENEKENHQQQQQQQQQPLLQQQQEKERDKVVEEVASHHHQDQQNCESNNNINDKINGNNISINNNINTNYKKDGMLMSSSKRLSISEKIINDENNKDNNPYHFDPALEQNSLRYYGDNYKQHQSSNVNNDANTLFAHNRKNDQQNRTIQKCNGATAAVTISNSNSNNNINDASLLPLTKKTLMKFAAIKKSSVTLVQREEASKNIIMLQEFHKNQIEKKLAEQRAKIKEQIMKRGNVNAGSNNTTTPLVSTNALSIIPSSDFILAGEATANCQKSVVNDTTAAAGTAGASPPPLLNGAAVPTTTTTLISDTVEDDEDVIVAEAADWLQREADKVSSCQSDITLWSTSNGSLEKEFNHEYQHLLQSEPQWQQELEDLMNSLQQERLHRRMAKAVQRKRKRQMMGMSGAFGRVIDGDTNCDGVGRDVAEEGTDREIPLVTTAGNDDYDDNDEDNYDYDEVEDGELLPKTAVVLSGSLNTSVAEAALSPVAPTVGTLSALTAQNVLIHNKRITLNPVACSLLSTASSSKMMSCSQRRTTSPTLRWSDLSANTQRLLMQQQRLEASTIDLTRNGSKSRKKGASVRSILSLQSLATSNRSSITPRDAAAADAIIGKHTSTHTSASPSLSCMHLGSNDKTTVVPSINYRIQLQEPSKFRKNNELHQSVSLSASLHVSPPLPQYSMISSTIDVTPHKCNDITNTDSPLPVAHCCYNNTASEGNICIPLQNEEATTTANNNNNTSSSVAANNLEPKKEIINSSPKRKKSRHRRGAILSTSNAASFRQSVATNITNGQIDHLCLNNSNNNNADNNSNNMKKKVRNSNSKKTTDATSLSVAGSSNKKKHKKHTSSNSSNSNKKKSSTHNSTSSASRKKRSKKHDVSTTTSSINGQSTTTHHTMSQTNNITNNSTCTKIIANTSSYSPSSFVGERDRNSKSNNNNVFGEEKCDIGDTDNSSSGSSDDNGSSATSSSSSNSSNSSSDAGNTYLTRSITTATYTEASGEYDDDDSSCSAEESSDSNSDSDNEESSSEEGTEYESADEEGSSSSSSLSSSSSPCAIGGRKHKSKECTLYQQQQQHHYQNHTDNSNHSSVLVPKMLHTSKSRILPERKPQQQQREEEGEGCYDGLRTDALLLQTSTLTGPSHHSKTSVVVEEPGDNGDDKDDEEGDREHLRSFSLLKDDGDHLSGNNNNNNTNDTTAAADINIIGIATAKEKMRERIKASNKSIISATCTSQPSAMKGSRKNNRNHNENNSSHEGHCITTSNIASTTFNENNNGVSATSTSSHTNTTFSPKARRVRIAEEFIHMHAAKQLQQVQKKAAELFDPVELQQVRAAAGIVFDSSSPLSPDVIAATDTASTHSLKGTMQTSIAVTYSGTEVSNVALVKSSYTSADGRNSSMALSPQRAHAGAVSILTASSSTAAPPATVAAPFSMVPHAVVQHATTSMLEAMAQQLQQHLPPYQMSMQDSAVEGRLGLINPHTKEHPGVSMPARGSNSAATKLPPRTVPIVATPPPSMALLNWLEGVIAALPMSIVLGAQSTAAAFVSARASASTINRVSRAGKVSKKQKYGKSGRKGRHSCGKGEEGNGEVSVAGAGREHGAEDGAQEHPDQEDEGEPEVASVILPDLRRVLFLSLMEDATKNNATTNAEEENDTSVVALDVPTVQPPEDGGEVVSTEEKEWVYNDENINAANDNTGISSNKNEDDDFMMAYYSMLPFSKRPMRAMAQQCGPWKHAFVSSLKDAAQHHISKEELLQLNWEVMPRRAKQVVGDNRVSEGSAAAPLSPSLPNTTSSTSYTQPLPLSFDTDCMARQEGQQPLPYQVLQGGKIVKVGMAPPLKVTKGQQQGAEIAPLHFLTSEFPLWHLDERVVAAIAPDDDNEGQYDTISSCWCWYERTSSPCVNGTSQLLTAASGTDLSLPPPPLSQHASYFYRFVDRWAWQLINTQIIISAVDIPRPEYVKLLLQDTT